MGLRGSNNPNTDLAIMTRLAILLPVGTQLAASSQSGTAAELIFIQQKYQMSLLLDQGNPSAINMSSGLQAYQRWGQRSFDGQTTIVAGYYSRWDNQDDTIDNIWAGIAQDLERMKSNAESNDTTAYGGTNGTMSIAKLTLDPYEGQFDKTISGLTLVKRNMYITYNLLPYGV